MKVCLMGLTLIDEIEEIKAMIERNKKVSEAKDWKREKKLSNLTTDIKKLERSIDSVISSRSIDSIISLVDRLNCSTEVNTVRVSILEEKQYVTLV